MRWRRPPMLDPTLNEAGAAEAHGAGRQSSAPAPAGAVSGIPPRRRLEIWLPIVIIAFDQLTKAAVRATLPLHASREIVPGLLDITHVRNTGAAFGILNAVDFP